MRKEQQFPLEEVMRGGRLCRAYAMPFQNIYDTLKVTAERYPDKVGIIDANGQITYADLRKRTDDLAAYLHHELGVGAGSRVAMMMVNSIDFCVVLYAVLKLGATVVSVNTKCSRDEIRFVLDNSQASCLILDDRWYGRIESALPETAVEHVIISGSSDRHTTLRQAVEQGRTLPATKTAQDDTLTAVIMYTSGTTGRSKGAAMNHFNLLQAMYAYAIADDMDETESTVLAVPAFHITGLNCIVTLFVFLGGLMVMTPFFEPVEVLDKMTEYRVTHFHAVATVFIMLESAMLDRHDLSALRTALCGGGFISRETVRRFCRKAPTCSFHPVYGMTETAGAGTYFPVHCLTSDIENSCGKVEPNCQIKIVDSQEQEVPAGVSGEICFRGAFIIDSYLHGIGNENIVDGWLHSGDVGYFDENGYLFIKDRIKDMINRGGEKVFSLAVEDAIMEFGNIKQAAVFAVDDSLYGEVPAAVVIPKPGETVDLEKLRLYLRDRLAHYKVPVYMELREVVPTTANGKPQKYRLREEFNKKYAK